MSDEDVVVDQDEAPVEAKEELSEEEQAIAKLKEVISVERADMGALRVKLTIAVPQDAMDERRSEQFTELKRDAIVPGFRKGHAPLALIEKRFASDVGRQLKASIISHGYEAAIEKEELKPLGDPHFWVKVEEERLGENQTSRKVETEKLLPIHEALDHIVLPKQGLLTFSCEVELKPEFELPELKKIPVTRAKVAIEDDDVEAEMRRMQLWRGTYQPVEQGAVEPDDLFYADMKMTVEGELIASEDNLDLAARGVRVQGIMLQGLGDVATGKTLGDSVTIEAPVPDDYENIDIRGKTATFEFTIREIKRLQVPPLDDQFLSLVGFDSKEEFQETIRSSLESRLDTTMKEAMRSQIGAYLVDKTELEIPEGISQRQTDRTLARRRIEMYRAGMPESEIDKNMDDLRAKAQEQAIRDLKLFFILQKIAEQRDITITEEQLNGAISQIASRSHRRFDRVRDELSRGDGLMVLASQIRDQQVLDALLDDAEITESEGPKKKKRARSSGTKSSKKKKATKGNSHD